MNWTLKIATYLIKVEGLQLSETEGKKVLLFKKKQMGLSVDEFFGVSCFSTLKQKLNYDRP